MTTHFIRTTAAITAIAFVSSCTNIKDDQTRTRAEGTLAGSLVGGGLGAIIGHQSGRGIEGALIGAAAGGLVGLAVGDHVARKKAKYASQEAWLDACIAHAEQVNRNAVSYNNSLRSKIAGLESRLAAAKRSGDSGEIRRVKAAVVDLQQETSKQIKVVDTEISEQGGVVRQTSSGSLSSRVTDLRSTRSSLSSSQERLADLGNQADA
jgi:predicted lipid-binding transport protein (Tim44 family)